MDHSAGAKSREGSCESHEPLNSGATAHRGCFLSFSTSVATNVKCPEGQTEVAAESKTG